MIDKQLDHTENGVVSNWPNSIRSAEDGGGRVRETRAMDNPLASWPSGISPLAQLDDTISRASTFRLWTPQRPGGVAG
jgi:hypothetical protein